MGKNTMGIGKRLRERVAAKGLTGNGVARQIGIDPRRFNHYLNEKREPDYEQLTKICQALETHPNYLLGFDDSPELMPANSQMMTKVIADLEDIKKRLDASSCNQ